MSAATATLGLNLEMHPLNHKLRLRAVNQGLHSHPVNQALRLRTLNHKGTNRKEELIVETDSLFQIQQQVVVNDHHSELNRTSVNAVMKPRSEAELVQIVIRAIAAKTQISICGGRHAMGGQQFLSDAILIDTTEMDSVLQFDRQCGYVTVEAGIMWPALISYLQSAQNHSDRQWTISQKQTGCDLLTIGGALAANIHGRGLDKRPLVEDIESYRLVMADGSVKVCSREENSELFRLAIGGYGAFGVVSSVTLRLAPLVNLRRHVRVCHTVDAVRTLESQRDAGATFGDFQFSIDDESVDFLRTGILSTYTPVDVEFDASSRKLLSESQWEDLLFLAHSNKSAAFEKYKQHYLATDGQIYASDTFQSATYINGYHQSVDKRLRATCKGSEAITELYVPRPDLDNFMTEAAVLLKKARASVIYGTVRLINRDDETFLPWASNDWACMIFNLHVDHEFSALSQLTTTFRNLYQLCIEYGGKYYLTYNKFATAEQLLTCYPQIPEFLELKRKYDPDTRFTSNWLGYLNECVLSAQRGIRSMERMTMDSSCK